MHALVIPAKSSHIELVQKAQAKTPVAMVVGQVQQLISNLLILGNSSGNISIAGLADANCCAGQSDRYA